MSNRGYMSGNGGGSNYYQPTRPNYQGGSNSDRYGGRFNYENPEYYDRNSVYRGGYGGNNYGDRNVRPIYPLDETYR